VAKCDLESIQTLKKLIEIMVPEVKNAPYGRLALVGCDITRYLGDYTQQNTKKKYSDLRMFSTLLDFFFQNGRKRL